MTRIIQGVLFCLASILQVTLIDAKGLRLPAEDPKDCIKVKSIPCAITTGDRPRMFLWDENQYELDRNLVMQTEQKKIWNVYQGLLVVKAKKSLQLHTPFAEIYLENAKAMIHVLENKVRVLSLDGQGIKVLPQGSQEEQFLVPGFQNWYGGVEEGLPSSGVAMVIDFKEYSVQRAKFFLDHQLGFPKELERVASRVKWAAQKSAEINKELVERKMASLEEQHQTKIKKKYQKIQFDKYLRKLFLKKMRYDD